MNVSTEHVLSAMYYYTPHTHIFLTGESHGEGEGISQQFMRTIMKVKCNENTEFDAARPQSRSNYKNHSPNCLAQLPHGEVSAVPAPNLCETLWVGGSTPVNII